jgi:hypothetical protein
MLELLRRPLARAAVLAALPLLLIVPLPAQAQPVRKAAAPARAAAKARVDLAARYKQVTRHDFEEHVVDGDRANPFGTIVDTVKHGVKSSLITVRTHFVPEMVRSAEDL